MLSSYLKNRPRQPVEPPAARRQRTATAAPRMAFDPDTTPAALDTFHAWLTKSGVKLGDNMVLAGRSPLAGGRGLVTTRAVENGQAVLAIPQSLGLTAAGLKKSSIAKYLTGFEGWTGDTGLIALQVLWERAQGGKSTIAPWIAVMPTQGELGMPLFWDEETLALADASSTRVRNTSWSVVEPCPYMGCIRAFACDPSTVPRGVAALGPLHVYSSNSSIGLQQ